jgi:hypothetical protein
MQFEAIMALSMHFSLGSSITTYLEIRSCDAEAGGLLSAVATSITAIHIHVPF